jgi:hypothetical protein
MKSIKKLKLILFSLILPVSLLGNSTDSSKIDLTVGADLVSHYIWRGLMLGNAPAIQPTMSINYGGLSFGSWASYSVSPSAFQEVDLFLTYSIGSFTLGVNDYYNPVDSLGFSDNYFDYGKTSTLHSFEPFVTISEIGGTGFSTTAAVFVYGNDRDDNGKNYFSSYFELSYATSIKETGLNLFGGATFNEGYYADKAAVVNLGVSLSRDLKLTDNFSVPMKGSFIVNPNTENVYFVLGFTF